MSKAFLVGIIGPTAAGKTTFTKKLAALLSSKAVILSHDFYYKDQSHKSFEERKKVNYDDLETLDNDLFIEHLHSLKSGSSVEVPVYDYVTHTRKKETRKLSSAPIVLVEGAFMLALEKVRELLDLKVFIDVPEDERLARRIKRDIEERGRDLDFVLYQWFTFVKPGEEKFINPYRKFADIVVLGGGENKRALEVIAEFLRSVYNG